MLRIPTKETPCVSEPTQGLRGATRGLGDRSSPIKLISRVSVLYKSELSPVTMSDWENFDDDSILALLESPAETTKQEDKQPEEEEDQADIGRQVYVPTTRNKQTMDPVKQELTTLKKRKQKLTKLKKSRNIYGQRKKDLTELMWVLEKCIMCLKGQGPDATETRLARDYFHALDAAWCKRGDPTQLQKQVKLMSTAFDDHFKKYKGASEREYQECRAREKDMFAGEVEFYDPTLSNRIQ